MKLCRAVVIAACALAGAVVPATAQFQPIPRAQQPQQEPPPCVKEFLRLREDAQKKADAIRQASERKASPQEACTLFNAFSAAEVKMIKYAGDNGVWCGIPKEVLENLRKAHTQTASIRTRVCQAAAAPPRPAGPSLSDALTSPVPNSSNIKTGRGTFDTLTGTPLGTR
jgi:hypothetical protein